MCLRYSSFVLVVVAASILAATPVSADEFFKGKTVTVVVPSGSGGTFHVYGQLVQRHIGKHIPGRPTVVVQNRPGAGGATAAAYLMNAAPQDGTVIAEIAPGVVTLPLFRPSVKFDVRKFQWLGAIAVRTYTIGVWHTVPVKSIEDMRKIEVKMGTTGKGSTGYQIPTFINYALGTRMKVILGYKGGGAVNLAIERGEVQGRGNFYSGYTGVRPEWIRDKKIRFLLKLGPDRPELKNVPNIRDYLKPGSIQARAWDVLETNLNVGQSFFVPPGVPAERVAILRKAFEDTMKDPELVAEAKKRRVPLVVRTATEIEKAIADGYRAATPEVVAQVAKLMGYGEKAKKKK